MSTTPPRVASPTSSATRRSPNAPIAATTRCCSNGRLLSTSEGRFQGRNALSLGRGRGSGRGVAEEAHTVIGESAPILPLSRFATCKREGSGFAPHRRIEHLARLGGAEGQGIAARRGVRLGHRGEPLDLILLDAERRQAGRDAEL